MFGGQNSEEKKSDGERSVDMRSSHLLLPSRDFGDFDSLIRSVDFWKKGAAQPWVITERASNHEVF
jgi:hypothetical protein